MGRGGGGARAGGGGGAGGGGLLHRARRRAQGRPAAAGGGGRAHGRALPPGVGAGRAALAPRRPLAAGLALAAQGGGRALGVAGEPRAARRWRRCSTTSATRTRSGSRGLPRRDVRVATGRRPGGRGGRGAGRRRALREAMARWDVRLCVLVASADSTCRRRRSAPRSRSTQGSVHHELLSGWRDLPKDRKLRRPRCRAAGRRSSTPASSSACGSTCRTSPSASSTRCAVEALAGPAALGGAAALFTDAGAPGGSAGRSRRTSRRWATATTRGATRRCARWWPRRSTRSRGWRSRSTTRTARCACGARCWR